MLSWCPSIKEPRQVVNSFSMLYKSSRHGLEPTRRIQKGQYLATYLHHIEVIRFKFHWVLGGVFGWLGSFVPPLIIRANDNPIGLQELHHRSSVSIYLDPVVRTTDGHLATKNWAQQSHSEKALSHLGVFKGRHI